MSEFSAKAKTLHGKSKLEIVKQMVLLTVRKYFLYHNVKMVGEAQCLVDYFFKDNESEKRALKMIQAKKNCLH